MHVGFAKASCQRLQQVSDVTIVTSLLGNQPQGYVFPHISSYLSSYFKLVTFANNPFCMMNY